MPDQVLQPDGSVVDPMRTQTAQQADEIAHPPGGPTNEYGLLSAMPANGSRPNNSTYFATDQYGGTVYRMVAGVWTQQSAGVNQASGQIIAGPAQLTTSFDVKAVGTSITDVPLMSIAVPASARPVLLRAKFEVQANSGTAAANSALTIRAVIADAANNNLAEGPVTFVQVAAAAVIFTGTITLELYLPTPVAAATYKIRASTTVAVPANWTSAFLLPGNGIAAGVADNFYAQAA